VNSSAQLFLTPRLSSKRIGSRGRKTDRDRNRKIANIVGLYDADWWNGSKLWRQESSLRHICADLDQAEIPVPSNWLWGRTPGLSRIGVDLRSWMKRWRRCRRASRGSGAWGAIRESQRISAIEGEDRVGVLGRVRYKKVFITDAIVSIIGILFAGSFVIQELLQARITGTLGLSTCAYGLIFYISMFITSLRGKSRRVHE
jgi:hypothetical protein